MVKMSPVIISLVSTGRKPSPPLSVSPAELRPPTKLAFRFFTIFERSTARGAVFLGADSESGMPLLSDSDAGCDSALAWPSTNTPLLIAPLAIPVAPKTAARVRARAAAGLSARKAAARYLTLIGPACFRWSAGPGSR